jgi:hypothetical protein
VGKRAVNKADKEKLNLKKLNEGELKSSISYNKKIAALQNLEDNGDMGHY